MHYVKKGLAITLGVAVGLLILRNALNYVYPAGKAYFGLA